MENGRCSGLAMAMALSLKRSALAVGMFLMVVALLLLSGWAVKVIPTNPSLTTKHTLTAHWLKVFNPLAPIAISR